MSIVTYEDKFYEILKDMYIGTPIKGDSGYVNLMTMKAKHFEIIEEELTKVVNEKTKKFPEFKEELYERLYDFFRDYFTDTGSIYYTYNELNKNTYEKVYSENEDVSLFWKTQMLYYVKTDILYQDIEFEVDDIVYYFDVSKLDHKRNNEKREIIYRECKVEENKDKKKIIFYPEYSVRGRTTKTNDILKKINDKGINIIEEELLKIFRIFEKQSEVDYFINKNSKKFLRDRFDVYLYQYMFGDGERSYNKFNEKRINQLMVLKDVAYDVIDFISQFEDELVRVWNKPKFVLNSNYVITLSKLEDNSEIIEKIINHKNFDKQIEEWVNLAGPWSDSDGKIIKPNWNEFLGSKTIKNDDIFVNKNGKKVLKGKYKYLPIDTKYFKDIELDILSNFNILDEELDGWLIHSENYQALNTIKNKFYNMADLIYIDPPFNKEEEADYLYKVKYKDSIWLSLLRPRLELGKEILNDKGHCFVRCDYNGNAYIRMLMNSVYGRNCFKNELTIKRSGIQKEATNKFLVAVDSLFYYTKSSNTYPEEIYEAREIGWVSFVHYPGERKSNKGRELFGTYLEPPKGRHWGIKQELIDEWLRFHWIRLRCKKCGYEHYEGIWKGCPKCGYKDFIPEIKNPPKKVDSNWTNVSSYTQDSMFSTRNAEDIVKRTIQVLSKNTDNLIIDYFLGSGTTAATAHKLNNKWIGIEVSDYFYTLTLPRMKRVVAGDNSGVSNDEDVNWKGGGFFKYYELEQYEDTLRKSVYKDDEHLIYNQNKSPFEQYVFLRDEKLNYCMEIQGDEVKVDLSKLYEKIDIPETLSNLTGKWIKKITEDEVIFEDGTKVDLNNIDYKMIKPLIWWCE